MKTLVLNILCQALALCISSQITIKVVDVGSFLVVIGGCVALRRFSGFGPIG